MFKTGKAMIVWEKQKEDSVRCLLCPHRCTIRPGEGGLCGARINQNGELNLVTAGIISGYALDPVEKKPLYHFFPGSSILSVGSYGCNLSCDFCQNYHISQSVPVLESRRLDPAELVRQATAARGNIGIAYTYNEPVIWFEYVMECAGLASRQGLRNVMVTNGYVNPEPLKELIRFTDAFNIDLKAFNNDFYRRFTGATLQPVLESIKAVAASGRHLEITTLIVPGLNDTADEMKREAEWIAENAGRHVPLHLSRYFPVYRRSTPATPAETIMNLRDIASVYLDYVYTGNMAADNGGSDTVCPSCHSTVIVRSGYTTRITGLADDGKCLKCGWQVITGEFI
jgi:pyruvate formate lyase activating enzyme